MTDEGPFISGRDTAPDEPGRASGPSESTAAGVEPSNLDHTDEPPSISDWLRMHADQTTQQATLVVPAWAKRRLDVMSPGMRQSIMEELDAIASPVVIVEATDC